MCASQPHGNTHVFLFSKETTKGTAVTPAKDLGLRQNFNDTIAQPARHRHTTGQAGVVGIKEGNVSIEGSMELLMQHGRVLELITGSVAHVETTSDWKHTFSLADDLSTFTLADEYELAAADISSTHAGCMFRSATIGVSTDNELSFRGDFAGFKTTDTTTAQADVISTIKTLSDFEADYKAGVLNSEASIAQVESWEVTFNWTTGVRPQLNSREGATIQAGSLEIEFATTLAFTSNAEKERLLGGATIASSAAGFGVVLTASNGTTLGSGRLEFYLQLSDCQYTQFGKTTPVGDYVVADVRGIGKFATMWYVDTLSSATF